MGVDKFHVSRYEAHGCCQIERRTSFESMKSELRSRFEDH